MSRKVEHFSGKHFELCKEWPEEDTVFLSLEGFSFEAIKNKVTVEIPCALWDVLRTYQGCNTELASLDDKALLARAAKLVDDRIAEWNALLLKDRKPKLWNMHLQDAAKPRAEQIRSELQRLFEDRESQREMVRTVEGYKKETTKEEHEKESLARQKQWKELGVQAEKRKQREEREYKQRQSRHAKAIDLLLRSV